ncbi:hypothetical protein DM02DRAFT_650100 [Periconia macrospinosa]|uniref:Transcription factor domain-containing protein n=1 Tax=Periconia macrospinosa TaxID=97972 RepID=A0A2V1E977_9PLEO|nr:hypothetical protein DM02DRAFT_650100 [Periconia macrospinosa]
MKVKCEGYNTDLEVFAYKPEAARPTKSLQATAMKIKYVDVFWEIFLPSMSSASRTPNGDWTRLVRDRYSTGDGPFKNALLAVTLSRVGQYSNNMSMTITGDNYYNACLRQIIQAINQNDKVSNDETIATCLLLSLYEILCSPVSAKGWLNHVQGLGTLIRLRGPHAFTSGISHELFASARLEMIHAAMVVRKTTFLGSPEWISIPWSMSNAPKSFYDRIIDISAQIPQILETYHRIKIAQPSNWEALLEVCWGLDNAMQDWCRDFYPICAPLHTDPTNSFTQSKPNLAFPLTAEARISFEHAQALSIYWTNCVFLYTTICQVWHETDSPSYLLPRRIDPHLYAVIISDSLPYFSGPQAGEGSLVFYTISVGVAIHYLSASGEAGSQNHQRLTDLITPEGDVEHIRARIGLFLKILAKSSVVPSRDTTGSEGKEDLDDFEVVELAQQWWGGGRNAITLPTRIREISDS